MDIWNEMGLGLKIRVIICFFLIPAAIYYSVNHNLSTKEAQVNTHLEEYYNGDYFIQMNTYPTEGSYRRFSMNFIITNTNDNAYCKANENLSRVKKFIYTDVALSISVPVRYFYNVKSYDLDDDTCRKVTFDYLTSPEVINLNKKVKNNPDLFLKSFFLQAQKAMWSNNIQSL